MKNIIRHSFLMANLFAMLAGFVYAQNTNIILPTKGTSSSFQVQDSLTTTILRINGDAGFYLGGAFGTGTIPIEGPGTRLMWHPAKAAFRTGQVISTNWDADSIGNYSVAGGYNTKAKGSSSVAMGYATAASGNSSTAMGYSTTASGHYSTAFGNATVASGLYSTAFGNSTLASGNSSLATGVFTTASGFVSTAMGRYVSTSGYSGAFIIGDASAGTTKNSGSVNSMTMRFDNGYVLYTDSGCTNYAYLPHDATAWSFSSDRTKKENFGKIDGEQILMKVREMPITEWNYKGTDPSVKYIGPVAQDFYSAFRLGGTDSLGINSLCIDGVNIAAVQALEKRTADLKSAMNELQQANEKIAAMEKRIQKLEQMITSPIINKGQ